ncbi:hypothetical protein L6452_36984 [Arctium lappa]|uniref:Uncharacterized protein n=1 Tax=Arctium lappa TaxID=4217 RepID=A0ACB8Y119_ARCLA|nr:hypothetical protein L6452_36984 [Arctium lappa]
MGSKSTGTYPVHPIREIPSSGYPPLGKSDHIINRELRTVRVTPIIRQKSIIRVTLNPVTQDPGTSARNFIQPEIVKTGQFISREPLVPEISNIKDPRAKSPKGNICVFYDTLEILQDYEKVVKLVRCYMSSYWA